MAELFDIVQGWTKELPAFTLKNNGVAYDLTGMTVRLFLRGKGKIAFNPTAGQVRIDIDQSESGNRGKVYYKPAATDMRADQSPYTCRWEVTDGAGDIVFFSNAEGDTISVHLP